jgi:hypothetical protein
MDIEPAGNNASLKQYRSVNGKWQFASLVKVDGKPELQLVTNRAHGSQIVKMRHPWHLAR